MKVLIGCEESQEVCKAFRALGHEAYSCDLQECSGGHPEWHIKGNVLDHLREGWDLGIFHPVCTRLANSGALRLYRGGQKINGIDWDKWADMEAAAAFFKKFKNLPYPHAIENPIMHKHGIRATGGTSPSQIIQPWQFGDPESKATCLWLYGLPKLISTNILQKPECGYWNNQTPSGQNKLAPGRDRAKIRSKTYKGIAQAMAKQWGSLDLRPKIFTGYTQATLFSK